MKYLILAVVLLGTSIAGAQTTFPGLKSVLTEAEWKRAGLDRLSPAELSVIDAALGRHESGATANLQTELVTAREKAAVAQAAAVQAAADKAAAVRAAADQAEAAKVAAAQAAEAQAAAARAVAQAATAAPAEAGHKRGLLARFGLPASDEANWRSVPPLKAKVVSWESANRFKLDNDQVWEGVSPITYELVDQPIEIHARPHGQFALIVNGKNTTLRIIRVR